MAQHPGESHRLIVVDGDVLVRHVISDYLRACGYVIIEAASTDEATVVLGDDNIDVRAVLCHADAPGRRSAFQLRAWALTTRPEMPVILAATVEAVAGKAAELCEDGPQLKRPYDPQSVVEYIRRITGTQLPDRLTKA